MFISLVACQGGLAGFQTPQTPETCPAYQLLKKHETPQLLPMLHCVKKGKAAAVCNT
jgi:hypothetical protein